MKKLIYILMATLLITGCTTQGNKTESKENAMEETPQYEVMYGKIKTMTGNEIVIDLAKDPFVDESVIDENPEAQEGEVIAATTLEASTTMSDAAASDAKENEAKMELEYTGESISLIVPTGVEIFDFIKGGELKLTDMKEGSVITITKDEKTGELVKVGVIEK
ncbi:hypothetical protein [Anaerorhabdus sp.]|uniref:hypothetical protein n=1 Tax=Anaerorhabdus sp. TaxID=1872524 RepID=UPI002FC65D16